MKCQNCAQEISENNKFCPLCGSPQTPAPVSRPSSAARCPACGGGVKAGQAFCMSCGAGLAGIQTAPSAVPQPPSKTPPPIVSAGPSPNRPVVQAPQAPRCPGCGAEVKAGQAFCMGCGTRMPVNATAAPLAAGVGQEHAQNQPPYYQAPAAATAVPAYGNSAYPAAGSSPYPAQALKGSGVGIRFLATFLDGIILSLVMGISMGGMLASQMQQLAYGTINYAVYAIPSILFFAYYILMEGLLGATVGKLACGLRVVSKNGEKCSIGKSLIRNLMRIVDGMFGYLLGAIFVWVTADNQRLGDMAAGTLVVKKKELPG